MNRQGSDQDRNIERPLDIAAARTMDRARPPYAIVDIGSNSVRLVVYDEMGRAPFPRFNEKSFCRLAAGLDETGELSAEGFRRTIEAARRFRAIADAMGASRIDVLATEATRRASNGGALVTAILEEAGLAVRVLSGTEEATFAALGVVSGFFRPVGLVGDMGGGSLEVAEVLDDTVGERRVSLPLGALPVQALIEKAGEDAKSAVDAILKDRLPPALTEPVFYAVGGGWRALAKAHMETVGSPVRVVHGYRVEARTLRAFAKSIWKAPAGAALKLSGIPARRAPIMPAAALVIDRVLKRLNPDKVIFSALGVREGWLYAQLPEAERYLDPLLEGAQTFGLPHSRIPAFATALTRWTARILPSESPSDRRLRVAACALSDMGWRDHDELRASESFRRLLHFPLIGIDHAERAFLAAIIHARYAGRANDPGLAPANALLSPNGLRRARILGLSMRLAYRFSGGVPDILERSRLVIGADSVVLEVGPAARVPDSEVVIERLQLLAAAVGVSRCAVTEVDL